MWCVWGDAWWVGGWEGGWAARSLHAFVGCLAYCSSHIPRSEEQVERSPGPPRGAFLLLNKDVWVCESVSVRVRVCVETGGPRRLQTQASTLRDRIGDGGPLDDVRPMIGWMMNWMRGICHQHTNARERTYLINSHRPHPSIPKPPATGGKGKRGNRSTIQSAHGIVSYPPLDRYPCDHPISLSSMQPPPAAAAPTAKRPPPSKQGKQQQQQRTPWVKKKRGADLSPQERLTHAVRVCVCRCDRIKHWEGWRDACDCG